jgi:retinol-binding protein 3
MKLSTALSSVAVLVVQSVCVAQGPTLDQARQQAVIDKTIELVVANYVYPERAKAVETALRANSKAGAYSAKVKPDDFLDALNQDMQAAAKDKHLRVLNNPRIVAQLRNEAAGAKDVSPEFLRMLRENNFRLRKAESLDGNVGYFKFDNFVELRFVREAFVGAMNFLHSSSALVLDLTDNGGGASETSDFLLSYFLPEGTRIGESWSRTTNQTAVSTVTRSPEVKQMLETPVYVLVSERTASAAEAVAYTLQQSKRAVIVGSRTKGMANAGQHFVIDDRLFVMVPTILNKNAVSGTNWEGAGIAPDIAVAPDKALGSAMASALKTLAERKTDKKEKRRLLFMAQDYASLISPQSPPVGFVEACIGEYEGNQRFVMKDGSLHFLKGEIDRRMNYMSDHTFTVEGRKDYRIRFPFEAGRVARCEVLWFDDTSDTYRRSK